MSRSRRRPQRAILAIGLGLLTIAASATPSAVIAYQPNPLRLLDAESRQGGKVARAGFVRPAPESTDPQVIDWIRRPTPDLPTPRAKSESTAATTYQGRDRVWIPALGIERSVSGFACSSSAYPGDRVYRWGCAGRNNVYLFGHAHSVFKPLHDAYVRDRLRKGMQVFYADASGDVNTYAVSWWRVTTPDKGEFAYAGQSRPSLTLQTCVGSKSQYRLIVRLTKVG